MPSTLSRLRRPISLRGRHRLALLVGAALLVAAAGFLLWLFSARVQALRARRATGPAWSFPSRIYSDGVPFLPNRSLPTSYLLAQLEGRGYRPGASPLRTPGTYAPVRGGYEIFLRGFRDAPDPESHGGPERVRLALTGGRLTGVERLGDLPGAPRPDLAHPPRLEPVVVSILADSLRVLRTWVPLARIPLVLRQAVVASEDRRFHGHLGLDLRSNLRALVTNVQARGVKEGGSTITQQLARGLFTGRERTFSRKLSEIFLALGLEAVLSKDEILEMYLNSVYWGQSGNTGVAGVAEAARWYFGVPVDSIDVGQAALLAGIIPAPNAYSPFSRPAAARARRDAVLTDMVEVGVLDARVAARERRLPVRARRGPPPLERFPSFTDQVRVELSGRLPRGAADHWGLSILSTLDLAWQSRAEGALASGIGDVERWMGRRPAPLEGAFVAMDPGTGRVRALVGGRSFGVGEFNRATRALRQPGSAFKPVVYATALDPHRRGRRFTPASTVPDMRREFATPEGPWRPRNDEGDYHEQVTLAKAIAKSLNVATANLVEAVGASEVARYAERFGLGRLRPVPSMGLGTGEVTLLALTDAYVTFVNGGVRPLPTTVRAVLDARGKVLVPPETRSIRVLPEQTAALMRGLLENVVTFGVSYPLRTRYGFTRPVAGKTGTTNDYNDAWFVGFTPDVVAGTWVGFDRPEGLGGPAAEIALPVWARIVSGLLEGFPATVFPARADIELVWIDSWSGGLARSDCPSKMRVPMVTGSAPRALCARDHASDWMRIRDEQAADSVAAHAADSTARADSLRGEPQ